MSRLPEGGVLVQIACECTCTVVEMPEQCNSGGRVRNPARLILPQLTVPAKKFFRVSVSNFS